MNLSGTIRVGIAGWAIPKASAERFPAHGSHLERYAACFNTVEINSSFYRPHRLATYQRWAATVPDDFRFTVKVPKAITHERRLVDTAERFAQFLSEVQGLGTKLGALLVQLPPSLRFDESVANDFFTMVRRDFPGTMACEPRHATWFTPSAARMLACFRVSYVTADPVVGQAPEGMHSIYYRLHGTPEIYDSSYADERLHALAKELKQTADATERWCIFDNTALGHATENALRLLEILR